MSFMRTPEKYLSINRITIEEQAVLVPFFYFKTITYVCILNIK